MHRQNVIAAVLSAVTIAALMGSPTSAQIGTPGVKFQYAAKFVCGRNDQD